MAHKTTQNSSFLNTRTNKENTERTGKQNVTKNTFGTRAALGDIHNRVSNLRIKDATKKPASKGLTKHQATTSLKKIAEKENTRTKAEVSISKISPVKAYSSHVLPSNVVDIDREDYENPQLVSEYVNDIYEYMRFLENKFAVEAEYLDASQEINGRMRAILMDWLIQVHLRFHLLQETLYLSVAIIDRFLSKEKVPKKKLQLVGVTAMLIASKYEEMYAPEIGDFEYITDNAYTKAEIRRMECQMLKSLDFNLGKPLCLHFLRRNSKAAVVDATRHSMAKYFMELTIIEYNMVHHAPSKIAAAALCLSMKVLGGDENWTDTMSFYSAYPESEIKPVMQQIAACVHRADTGKHTAVYNKYSSSKFGKISKYPELKGPVISKWAES